MGAYLDEVSVRVSELVVVLLLVRLGPGASKEQVHRTQGQNLPLLNARNQPAGMDDVDVREVCRSVLRLGVVGLAALPQRTERGVALLLSLDVQANLPDLRVIRDDIPGVLAVHLRLRTAVPHDLALDLRLGVRLGNPEHAELDAVEGAELLAHVARVRVLEVCSLFQCSCL